MVVMKVDVIPNGSHHEAEHHVDGRQQQREREEAGQRPLVEHVERAVEEQVQRDDDRHAQGLRHGPALRTRVC